MKKIVIASAMILGAMAAAGAEAQTAPSEKDVRAALGLPATGPVTVEVLRGKARAVQEAEGHVFFDAQGKADRKHFDRAHGLEVQRLKAVVLPPRAKKEPRKVEDIFPKLGKVAGGKIAKADFKGDPFLYRKLDPTGRGYVTAEDLKALHDLGRRAGSRDKAGRFMVLFDKDKDGKVTKAELPAPSADKLLQAADANKDGALTLDEVTQWIAKSADARRLKKIHK